MPENSNRTGQPTIQEADSATLLSTINSPDDLRRLQVTQLPQICAEIREFLINSLSVNPGHFASSMGAVELTVALHYVFNSPYDRIVWDVGHQAYVHKILTGRRDLFHTNRTFGGLSGFPNPAESPYDTFTAGHASNSISAALGMAVASESKHESPRRNVVAVIGDASISGGLAFEGLNNAANTPNNLLIILNDNDMSIDRNVGSLSSYLGHLNTSKAYNSLRFHLFHLLKKLHLIKDSQKGFLIRFANSLKSLLNRQQNIFEGLNIRYFGPIDGHDTARLVKVLSDIKDMHGPRLLHIRTVKGRGYAPAESNPASWHAPGKFDPATGRRDEENDSGRTAAPKYQEVFGQTLLELARADKRVVGITAAMPSGTSMNILQEAMPERVFDVGISEGHAVTFAGGMAKDGMRPFVAIYSSFMQRAYDHIIHDVAIQGLPVTLCLDRAGIVGEDGVTHHGVFDLCYLRSIPGMTVAAPRNESTLRNLMYTSLHQDGPMAIRYPRGRVHRRPTSASDASDMTALPIGRGVKLREGKDVAVLSLGTIGNIATDAVADAIARGIDTAHYDMIFLKPLDENILHEVGRSGMPIVTVEDGMIHGGFGSAVLEWLNEHDYRQPVRCIGVDDTFVEHGRVPQLMHLCGMDRDAIADAIESARKQSTTCE